MLKRTNLILSVVLLVLSSGLSNAVARGTQWMAKGLRPSFVSHRLTTNEREQDGLVGPVRRVKTETAKISPKNGKPVEGPRVVLETATYDIKGAKVDNAYFLAAGGSLTGKEVYKYDEKGNIVEMTMHNEDGSLLSKEVYSYEFDQIGNWTKMVTAVAVIEGGKMTFEPTEVTYRTISYFLDEAMMAKMAQPVASSGNAGASNNVAPSNNAAPASNAAVSNQAAPSGVPVPVSTPNVSVSSPAKNGAATAPVAVVPVEKSEGKSAATAKSNAVVKSEHKVATAPPPVASADRESVAAPLSLAASAGSSSALVVNADGEAPARPGARGPLKPVSGGILNGKAVSLPAPAYPEMARRQRATGMVTVEVVVDMTGRVISAKAVDGPVILRGAAEKAAMMARFSPTLLSGQPVKVSGQINYNFTLQ